MVGHCNRTKNDLIYQVLKAICDANPPTKTRIMYGAFLSYVQVKYYLQWLVEAQLIDFHNNIFSINSKGVEYMQTFEETESMFKCVEEPVKIPPSQRPRAKAASKVKADGIDIAVRTLWDEGVTNSYRIAKILNLPRGTVWHRVLKIKKEQSTRKPVNKTNDKLRLGRGSK